MKLFSKIISFAAYMLFVSVLYAENTISWRLAAFTVKDGMQTSFDVSKPADLHDGDEFGLLIETNSTSDSAYCYAVYEDTIGTATVLYSGKIPSTHKVELPAEGETFTVAPPSGTEKIHIVICVQQQKKLEDFCRDLENAKEPRKASMKVIDEINRLRQDSSSFTESAVKPAVTGGTTRGLSRPSVKIYSSFEGFAAYVKTVRIKH